MMRSWQAGPVSCLSLDAFGFLAQLSLHTAWGCLVKGGNEGWNPAFSSLVESLALGLCLPGGSILFLFYLTYITSSNFLTVSFDFSSPEHCRSPKNTERGKESMKKCMKHTLLLKKMHERSRHYFSSVPTIISLLPGLISFLIFTPHPSQLRVNPEESKPMILNLGYTLESPGEIFKSLPPNPGTSQTNCISQFSCYQ